MNDSFDPSYLKVPVTRGKEEADELEADNILTAFDLHFAHPPTQFDYWFLLDLHRTMFDDVWEWAGKTRRHDLNFGVPHTQVESKLLDLTKRLPYWTAWSLVEQCAHLHHELVVIHPFHNGNGRWSRLASDLWSVRGGGSPCKWPAALSGSVESPVRREYIDTLKAADKNDFKPLIALHERYAAEL